MSDFYALLGVPVAATQEEIKKSYRALQMKFHPDKNQNSPESVEMTQRLNRAYETLSDPPARAAYDRQRAPAAENTGVAAARGEYDWLRDLIATRFGPNAPADLVNIINSNLGGFTTDMGGFTSNLGGCPRNFVAPQHHALRRPPPICVGLEVPMDAVFHGGSFPVTIERWTMVSYVWEQETETVYVTVPPGIDSNEHILLENQGHVASNTCRGDVTVTVTVKNTTEFERRGLDLVLRRTITLKEALCGFRFELTLHGNKYTLDNHKGSIVPPDFTKVYRRMGIARDQAQGDLLIKFQVVFPDKLTDAQIDALADLL